MSKKVFLALVYILVVLVIGGGVFLLIRSSKPANETPVNYSTPSLSPSNMVESSDKKNESGYYFDDSYDYNLTKSTIGVLESVTDLNITISIDGNSNSYQFNTKTGFLLYCLPSSYVLSDGQTVKNIELGVDYSRVSLDVKKQQVQVSKNISISDKLNYLSEYFIGKDTALGISSVNPSIVETVYVYSDDQSVCEKI